MRRKLLSKTKEPVTTVSFHTDLEKENRVTNVSTRNQVVYTYDTGLEINYLDGRRSVLRNANDQVIHLHRSVQMRALSMADVMERMKQQLAEMEKNPPPPLTKEEQEKEERMISELSGMGGFFKVFYPGLGEKG